MWLSALLLTIMLKVTLNESLQCSVSATSEILGLLWWNLWLRPALGKEHEHATDSWSPNDPSLAPETVCSQIYYCAHRKDLELKKVKCCLRWRAQFSFDRCVKGVGRAQLCWLLAAEELLALFPRAMPGRREICQGPCPPHTAARHTVLHLLSLVVQALQPVRATPVSLPWAWLLVVLLFPQVKCNLLMLRLLH